MPPALFNHDRHCLPVTRAVYPRSTIRADNIPQRCWLRRLIVEFRYSSRKWKEITYLNACKEADDRPSFSNEHADQIREKSQSTFCGSYRVIAGRSLLISISSIFVPVLLTREMATDQCPEYCSHGNCLPVLKPSCYDNVSLLYRKRDSITYWCSTVGFIHLIHTEMMTWWQTSLGADGHSFLHSCCKFLKSSKFETNLIHEMDFASVELFPVTYLGSYLARKCETQQSCKQTVKQLYPWQRFTHYTIMKFDIAWSLF